MKTAAPAKKLVMNAVNQYGQQGNIAASPVDFLYTEVWPQNENYNDLFTIIQNNNTWSGNTKKTVLAAYMNYNAANNPGYFNTPGVLLADAVIFALGGAHIELGEHMLGKEYFPNSNLQMKPDLQKALVRYYDFLTAYQNLLRDGGSLNDPFIRSSDTKFTVRNWPVQSGTITLKGRDLGTKQVINFINFINSDDYWRDTDGTKGIPGTCLNVPLTWTLLSKTVKKMWYASPDINNGLPQQLAFTQNGTTVKFTLPVLLYWDMVVAEFE
jgi:dextranase